MILYRVRKWGAAEWSLISIGGGEENELDPILASILGSALATSSLHVQQLDDQGIWEDLE